MEKKLMCLSREEQDSMRALAGTAEETVELSNTLYQAVVAGSTPMPVAERIAEEEVLHDVEESPTRRALKTPPIPVFESVRPKH